MADLRDLRNRVRVRAYFAVSDASPRLQQTLRATSPRDSNYMADHTTVVPRGLEATARAAANYASFVRVPGTRPHVIRAKPGKKLSFFWNVTNRQMFLPKVNHPGYRGSSWWDNAIPDRWRDYLRDSLKRAP